MSRDLTFLHVVGARPNFMKIAPLLRALRARESVENLLVHTGQHYDPELSGDFFRDLGIPEPDVNLGVGSGTHSAQTGRVMTALEPILERVTPDCVVVVGDVNSTLAAALTAAKMGLPVAHVEAGLRSGDRTMPEEINRELTDRVADHLFAPGEDAAANLRREGIPEERIHVVGNIMIDSLEHAIERARSSDALAERGLEAGGYAVVTLHRPSNVDRRDRLAEILSALDELAGSLPVIFPVHPRTRGRMDEFGLDVHRVRTDGPVGYLEMLALLDGARVVLTDSGGIQEETTVLGVPCLTLRDTTERPVTLEVGTNRLVPRRDREAILAAVEQALAGDVCPDRPEGWDGRTSVRIADVLTRRCRG